MKIIKKLKIPSNYDLEELSQINAIIAYVSGGIEYFEKRTIDQRRVLGAIARNCKMNVNPLTKKVVFELLTYCNLSCSYCLYREKKHVKIPLPIHQIYRLIDKFSSENIERLVLTGGEPTLHPNFIDISKYAMLYIPRVSVCTNGVIIGKHIEKEIIRLNFSSYTISIDSHIGEIHDKIRGSQGAFEKAMGFIEKLRQKGKNISIHITLHIDNLDYVNDTVDFARGFSNNIVVSTIYQVREYHMLLNDKNHYAEKAKKVFSKYSDQPDIALVGFGKSCFMEHCLNKKNIFMINQYGNLIDCYWQHCVQI